LTDQIEVQAGNISQINQHVAVVTVPVPSPAERKKHSVLVLDCSLSMVGSIYQVREDAMKFVTRAKETEYISVVIFSGHGDADLIAWPKLCNEAGKSIIKSAINKRVRCIGLTVFSEPLKKVLDTVRQLAREGFGVFHNVVLFTDGQAVTTEWNESEEERRVINLVEQISSEDSMVSVMGYGIYYDAKFMQLIVTLARNLGVYRHISEIEDFEHALADIQKVYDETTLISINLTFQPDSGEAGNIYKTKPEVTLYPSRGTLFTLGVYQGQVQCFIELSEACQSLRIFGNIGSDQVDKTLPVTPLDYEKSADFIRVLGVRAYMTGDEAQAAEYFRMVGAEFLADKAESSFTWREQRETLDTFRRMYRNRRSIGAGLKPAGPEHCVLNVMIEVMEDDNVIYIPKGMYTRTTELRSDPYVVDPPHGRTLRLTSYTANMTQCRHNFSLKGLKDVEVRLPNQPVRQAKVWRTYVIIKDGNLHVPELKIAPTEASFQKFQEAGVISKDQGEYQPGNTYTLNLRGLRMVSKRFANPATLGLVDLLREEKELEAEQSALNKRKKALPAPAKPAFDGDGVYNEQSEKVEGVPVEMYTAPTVKIGLMGYKTQKYDVSGMTYDEAHSRVKEVRRRLLKIRWIYRIIIFAMEAAKSTSIPWGDSKTTKHGKVERLATYQGAKLKLTTGEMEVTCS